MKVDDPTPTLPMYEPEKPLVPTPVVYYFSTEDDAADFSRARFDRIPEAMLERRRRHLSRWPQWVQEQRQCAPGKVRAIAAIRNDLYDPENRGR